MRPSLRKPEYGKVACPVCGTKFRRASSRSVYCRWQCRLTYILGSFKDETTCWEWPLSINKDTGYGQINLGRGIISTHRAVMLLAGRKIKGHQVCHNCDNRRCINPKHLFVGTAQDNVSDMISKGRQARNKRMPRGDQHHSRVHPESLHRAFTPETALEIFESSGSSRALAAKYGCSHPTIQNIKRGRYYFG